MTFGKPGRPPEDRLARQREIFEAVAPLILTTGARKLSMREAAHAASLSVGGLYHYFPSKRDLLLHGLSHRARRRIFMDSRDVLRRISPSDRSDFLEIYIEQSVTLWAFVHPSVQAALELGYDEFQRRLDAGFAASTAEFAQVLRALAADMSDVQMAALVRAVQRLALGAVVERDFDRGAARASLRALLERFLPDSRAAHEGDTVAKSPATR